MVGKTINLYYRITFQGIKIYHQKSIVWRAPGNKRNFKCRAFLMGRKNTVYLFWMCFTSFLLTLIFWIDPFFLFFFSFLKASTWHCFCMVLEVLAICKVRNWVLNGPTAILHPGGSKAYLLKYVFCVAMTESEDSLLAQMAHGFILFL